MWPFTLLKVFEPWMLINIAVCVTIMPRKHKIGKPGWSLCARCQECKDADPNATCVFPCGYGSKIGTRTVDLVAIVLHDMYLHIV